MNSLALSKAKSRLRLTSRAAKAVEEASGNPAFEDNWTDFLVHWKGTYNKVQQAAKDTPQELQWFGSVNRERKADPLLRWLSEARNDEEHGLVHSAKHVAPHIDFDAGEPVIITEVRFDAKGMPTFIKDDGTAAQGKLGEWLAGVSELSPVKDRGGAQVPPPTRHQDKPMEPKPLIAVQLGLQWLEALVTTAEYLHTPSQ